MWLLAIEVLAAILAAARGWGWRPFAWLGLSFIFGFCGAYMFGTGIMGLAQILDIVLTICFIIMAITGRQVPVPAPVAAAPAPQDNRRRVPCPKCSELILEDAKFCRFCGASIEQPPAYLPDSDMVRCSKELFTLLGHQVVAGQWENESLYRLSIRAKNSEQWVIYCLHGQPIHRDQVVQLIDHMRAATAREGVLITDQSIDREAEELAAPNRVHLWTKNTLDTNLTKVENRLRNASQSQAL